MTDLAKGIIEISGFAFKPGTKFDEVLDFFDDKVRVLELSTGPRVKFLDRHYIADNLYAYAFNFSKDTKVLTNFSLHPVVPETVRDHGYGEVPKYKVAAAQKWLKEMIDGTPTSEDNESVLYSYDWGYIVSQCTLDREYGLVGGEIDFTFRARK